MASFDFKRQFKDEIKSSGKGMRKFSWMLLIGTILAMAISSYFSLTPLAKTSLSIWPLGFFTFLLTVALTGIITAYKSSKVYTNFLIIWTTIVILGFLISFITTTPIFNAKDYRDLLPKPTQKEFTEEIDPFDISKAPTVTESTAARIADKQFGNYPGNLGSRAQLGALTIQNINGDLYWVAPIEHKNFFSWFNNKNEGTPFVIVNANNKETKIIDGKMKYQPNSFFNQDLARKLYFNNPTKLYTDFTFEVDDNLKPYYTATIYKNTIGLGGEKTVGVAIVDAQTGEVKEYTVKNTPKWVDRIQPIDFVNKNINYSGEYIRGFSPFNDNGKLKATEGTGMVYNNGKCYYYTGITGIGKDNSSLGFYLVDTRTMETLYFKLSGATELAAVQSAEGKVQNLGYTGSFPILMKVENTPTYFVPLQDKNYLTKTYAMVNVEDYTLIGIGDTADEARNNYIKTLSGKNVLSNSSGVKKELSGKVLRVDSFDQDGNTYYSMILDNYNKIINIPISQSPKLPLTKEGDIVKITYIESTLDVTQTVSFDNLSILSDIKRLPLTAE